MHVLIFEDDAVDRLGLITACRPACDVTLGATTLHDALTAFGDVRRILRPRLARYVAALGGRRIPLWGGAPDPIPRPSDRARGGLVLLVNARAVPSRDTLVALRSLVEAGRRAVVRRDDTVVAALLHIPADGGTPDDRAVERIVTGDRSAVRALEELGLPAVESSIRTLDAPHEVVEVHEATLEGSLAVKIDSGRFRETRRGLFVADGADVADEVAVRGGPVVVAAGATVAPFACLDGPIWIGPRARVNPHAWLREGTSLGLECRAGGEIESSVLEPFSNKPHEGFLGHSHVGSWANLAAGTVTSNLKATYGPIRLHETRSDGGRTTVHTGRQFVGALVGDLVKTAINSSIPCGARLGVAAMVRGAVADVVPAFTNDILGGRSTAEQAATVLGRMMARRGLELLDADRALLDDLASAG